MDIQEHTKPENLLRYSFLWNQARLVIAAVSLIFGATPILSRLMPSNGLSLYILATAISGLAGAYLLYEWYKGGKKLFGGTDRTDLIAFMIATLSGIHLGLGVLFGGKNFIMDTLYGTGFLLTLAIYAGGVLYLWSAWHLHTRYHAHGEKLF